ncbi:Hypothetical predicted protein [Pelobates cultripes]|uniref:Uncharacterized protein n=1 Tax=Pelobates cultripes TaxID=61616 RepID=A0AAD1W8X0_PELCU|nr:Hypothetical predicted protein [Pelobates cultripes]
MTHGTIGSNGSPPLLQPWETHNPGKNPEGYWPPTEPSNKTTEERTPDQTTHGDPVDTTPLPTPEGRGTTPMDSENSQTWSGGELGWGPGIQTPLIYPEPSSPLPIWP